APQSPSSVRRGAGVNRWLFAVLACVFVLKLAILLQLNDHPLLQPSASGGLDTQYYLQLAQRVAAGDLLLAPGLYFVSPLYIYFLAGLLMLGGGSLFFVKVVQIALGTAACALVWLAAREWFSIRAAWLALALCALAGAFTFYEVLILQAAVDPFLTALDVSFLCLALRRGGWTWTFGAGLALGLHVLNRPNMLVVGAGLACVLLARAGTRRLVPAFLAGLAVALAPVSLRNGVAAGTFSPIPSHGGLNFYIGNNPDADGTYHRVPGITPNIAGQAEDARRVAERAEGRRLSDGEVSSFFTRRAIAWWRHEPAAASRLFVRKLAYTLNRSWLTLNYSYPFYRDEFPVLRGLWVGPLLLLPLGLVGLFSHAIAGRAAPDRFWVWAGYVPLTILSIAIFFVASRYRIPLLVALCVTAGGALDAVVRAAHLRRRAALAAASACVIPMVMLAAWDFGLDDSRAEEETRLAVWLVSNGRASEAEAHLARVGDTRLSGIAEFRVGQAFERTGDLAGAVRHYQRATEIDAGEPAPRAALARAAGQLGVTLAQQNRDAEALPLLEQAARLAPADAPAQLNLAVEYARLGRYSDARVAAGLALKLDPRYQRAREFFDVLRAAEDRR
ncbi:MAG TPA: glycosyltransferase family 39 protein, partial [Gemmatimonadaceae bacterium]